MEDRKRIQHLLAITQPLNAETTYLLRERPVNVVVHQHKEVEEKVGNTMSSLGGGRGPGGHKVRNETEKGTVANVHVHVLIVLITVAHLYITELHVELPQLSGERCICITFKDLACLAGLPQGLSW